MKHEPAAPSRSCSSAVLVLAIAFLPVAAFQCRPKIRLSRSIVAGQTLPESFFSADDKLSLQNELSNSPPIAYDEQLIANLNEKLDYEGRMTANTTADNDDAPHRCGYVALVGAPNQGKSTLLNALLQQDLCIATPRPQTTRHAILGLLSTPSCQVCLVDTPGMIAEPAYALQSAMMEAVQTSVATADVLLVVSDVTAPLPSNPEDKLFAKVQKHARSNRPVIVALNKVDQVGNIESVAYATIVKAVAQWRALLPQAVAILPVTAAVGGSNVGVTLLRNMLTNDDIVPWIRALGRPIPGMFTHQDDTTKLVVPANARDLLPISPALYDAELLTDRPERFVAAELIRSALFTNLRKELPYCCEVQVTRFKELPMKRSSEHRSIEGGPLLDNTMLHLDATVSVERDSQKQIVVGQGGAQIKQIGIAARKSLQEFFQMPINLKLQVVVDKDWRRNARALQSYGYSPAGPAPAARATTSKTTKRP